MIFGVLRRVWLEFLFILALFLALLRMEGWAFRGSFYLDTTGHINQAPFLDGMARSVGLNYILFCSVFLWTICLTLPASMQKLTAC
ncbi:hypothetical protein QBC41DRAFT_141175 [Cercophora samala]|uniref:Uncharacterized protein n=1 Tax=Cercophora samala TaxID=330535 RepID=A0AA39ZA85_9PEZI|nr:hypothetical protein QBC41DRAFT_141175 [Cercophora samala]